MPVGRVPDGSFSAHMTDGTYVNGVTRVTRSNREQIATFVTEICSIVIRHAGIRACSEGGAVKPARNAAANRAVVSQSDTLGNR
jgi:hypothetical protein